MQQESVAILYIQHIYLQIYYLKPTQTKTLQMFSLSDQIQKFQDSLLSLPDTVITLDQRFLGGGIKMQDLIQENSFIITEMRKFKAVFLNYCKLNDKIYKKIIEHEVNANEHYNKVLGISNIIDRKIQENDQEIKKTKEELRLQMTRLNQLVDNGFKDIRGDLANKVGLIGFPDQVKKIIDQYQQQNATSSIPSDPQHPHNPLNPNTDPSSSLPNHPQKKRRGLTQQDIQAFKSQITPLIDQLHIKISSQNTSIKDMSNNQTSQLQKIKKIIRQNEWLMEDINNIKKNIDDVKGFVKDEDNKIIDFVKDNTCENVWMSRFEEFRGRVLEPRVVGLEERFYRGVHDLRKQIQANILPKFPQITNKLTKQAQRQHGLQQKISKTSQRIGQTAERIDKSKTQLHNQLSEQSKRLQKLTLQQTTASSKKMQQLSISIKQLSQNINNIIYTTQEAVLKKVQIKLGKDMKQIRGDINSINKKIGELNHCLKTSSEQVDHVKDIVATKANFTDLVKYFDKKADREDFKELQELVESPRGGFMTVGAVVEEFKNSDTKLGQRKRRKSSYSRGGLTTPLYTRPEQLMMGRQSPESKQLLKNIIKTNTHHHTTTAKIKTKSMRPSTANTLFMI